MCTGNVEPCGLEAATTQAATAVEPSEESVADFQRAGGVLAGEDDEGNGDGAAVGVAAGDAVAYAPSALPGPARAECNPSKLEARIDWSLLALDSSYARTHGPAAMRVVPRPLPPPRGPVSRPPLPPPCPPVWPQPQLPPSPFPPPRPPPTLPPSPPLFLPTPPPPPPSPPCPSAPRLSILHVHAETPSKSPSPFEQSAYSTHLPLMAEYSNTASQATVGGRGEVGIASDAASEAGALGALLAPLAVVVMLAVSALLYSRRRSWSALPVFTDATEAERDEAGGCTSGLTPNSEEKSAGRSGQPGAKPPAPKKHAAKSSAGGGTKYGRVGLDALD